MSEEVKEEKIQVSGGKIDPDVLDVLKQEDILKSISDDKQAKRLILNCFCELLSEIKGLRSQFEEFSQMISVCSADKLSSFFKELQKNIGEETKRIELNEKIKESHKKSTKKGKKSVK